MKNRILVVEDEVAVANAFSEYLSNLGFHVDCTDSFEQALGLAGQHHYSVLLTDLRLQQGGIQAGFDFVKVMSQQYPQTAIAVLSGAIGPDDVASVQKMGARAVLRKPKALAEIGQILMGLCEPAPAPLLQSSHAGLPAGTQIAKLTARGTSDAQIAEMYETTNEVIQEIRSEWFNAMPPRERMAISRELSRRTELTH